MNISYTLIDNHHISIEPRLFLVIVSFHIQKKINDKKLNGMFRSLRDRTILRKINVYNCNINNKWYSDEMFPSILLEVYNEICIKQDFDLEVILKYLNKCFNANRNYCIDWIYFNLVSPVIDSCEYSYQSFEDLKSFNVESERHNIISYKEADKRGLLGSGYCCSDCDGCYGEYKKRDYQRLYDYDFKEYCRKIFKNYLLNQKTHKKNPYDRLLSIIF